MDLYKLTIAQALEGLSKKTFSAVELAQSNLDRIEKTEKKIEAFITITKDDALARAKAVDNGKVAGLLAGIPGSLKDVLATKGVRTTACSNILKDYVAPYDATAVAHLKKAGVSILGKNNCDAFAHGASTENSDFKTTHNPWDLTRVPGGSSGGSAAAVAAGQGLFSIGTDTGGSIRHPAAFCGISSIKPTYGRVSRYGLLSMTSSTDCVSPMAKTVEGLAYLLEAMAGKDKFDSSTLDIPVSKYHKEVKEDSLKGKVIGVPKEYFIEGLNSQVKAAVNQAIEQFKSMGAKIKAISLPHTKYAVAVYYIITPCEVSSNLARYDGIRFGYSASHDDTVEVKDLIDAYLKTRGTGFGDEAKRRIMIGTYALSAGYYDAYYKQASKVRTLIRHDFQQAFKEVDLIVTPVAPNTAFKIGERVDDPLQMYLEDVFLAPVSLAGLPALSIPCGFASPNEDDTINLPIGLQIIAPQFKESNLLQAGYQFQQETDWHKKVIGLKL